MKKIINGNKYSFMNYIENQLDLDRRLGEWNKI